MSSPKSFVVKRTTAADCALDLPSLELYDTSDQAFDLLVTAKGFEERVLAFPSRLVKDGRKVSHAVLVGNYQTNRTDNDQRYTELRPLLQKFGAQIVEFDADDPPQVVSSIEESICAVTNNSPVRIAFDVSGASSTLIFAVMAAITRSQREISLTVLYATAQVYDSPPFDDVAPLVLGELREEGVGGQPLSVPFCGHHHDHLPMSVIALPSMFTGRLEACLAHLSVGPITGSFDNLYWLLPSTGTDEHKWRQDHTRKAVEALMRRLQGREDDTDEIETIRPDDVTTCDVFDYAETMRLLIARIDDLPGNNISIVHMGSKLQAIGVSLAVTARCEAAVLTARPAAFNAKTYSSGIGSLHSLHFPNLRNTLNSVANIGTLTVECL